MRSRLSSQAGRNYIRNFQYIVQHFEIKLIRTEKKLQKK